MRKLCAFLAFAVLMAISMTMQGCGEKMQAPTAPSTSPPVLTGGQLPLVNGQGPPHETPPDSIVARAEHAHIECDVGRRGIGIRRFHGWIAGNTLGGQRASDRR